MDVCVCMCECVWMCGLIVAFLKGALFRICSEPHASYSYSSHISDVLL